MFQLKRYSIALVLVLPLAARVDAQPIEDFQTWAAVIATGPLGAQEHGYRFWLEAQGRYDDDSSHLNQSLLRGAAGVTVRPGTVLWAGYAHVNNDPQGTDEDVTEHRYWQQLTWQPSASFGGWRLSTRTRLEQRTVESAADTGWRFRHLSKVTREIGADGGVYASAWHELFVNFNTTDWGADSGLDQNRAFIGLGASLASSVRAELGYLNQWIRRDQRADALNHILSLSLFVNF